MKILHIASFIGNIGDILSNHALHRWLERRLGGALALETLEIRRFHRQAPADWKLDLDEVLADADCRYDRIVIGGGGFLDYWIPGSGSGATIDAAPATLEALRTPLVISSVGAYPLRDPPEENYARFRTFLEAAKAAPNVSLMLRNDGSLAHIGEVFGADLAEGLVEAGDHCYLLDEPVPPAARERPYLVVNIAPDQLVMNSHLRGDIDRASFYDHLAAALLEAAEARGADVVVAPHLPLDFRAVLELVDRLPDAFVRERLKTAGFDGTPAVVPAITALYAHSEVNICNRLHANILSLVLGRPTVSLSVLARVAEVARQHPEARLVNALDRDFTRELSEAAEAAKPCDRADARAIAGRIADFLDGALKL